MATPVSVIFNRFGPYHVARLRAAASIPATGIEVVRKDSTYRWDIVRSPQAFRLRTLLPHASGDHMCPRELNRRLWSILDEENPVVVAVPGWSSSEALSAVAWCVDRSVPAVLMSDSQQDDFRRFRISEGIKRQIVGLTSAALVAGRRHAEYIAALGMPRERIFQGYDVVDNEHFHKGAEAALRDEKACRTRGAGECSFLVSCRFIPEKNLDRLLRGFALYRSVVRSVPWSLVLLGDGPNRQHIELEIQRLRLGGDVFLADFRQYDELPAYYAVADVFVLPSIKDTWGLVVNEAMASGLPVLVSNRCGCAPDLVEEGRNGYTFDPYDTEQLASLMLKFSSMPKEQRQAMGDASREIISRWTPETFAENLMNAVEVALDAPRPKPSVLDRTLLWALMHRP